MNYQEALGLARHMISTGMSIDEATSNSAIPHEYRNSIKSKLLEEETFVLKPTKVISEDETQGIWLDKKDRDDWYYWPRLRAYLSATKGWPSNRVRSLDDSSDKVLRNMSDPEIESFNKKGLVLGYVQSGKTANYTALIAKAVDVGYRLIIVLAGMDNGLRRQTQIRLQQELVGYPDNSRNAVRFPEQGKVWHVFTKEDIHGDFDAGSVDTAALHGNQPVLMVIKKNGAILRRVLRWLTEASPQAIQNSPVLLIDDEADQASIDTRGTYQAESSDPAEENEPPSVINGLIRQLASHFCRCAYVAYTATPYANILIPADANNPDVGEDLYPRDFFIDLPKPDGYMGAEELFGKAAFSGDETDSGGLDIIRYVPDEDVDTLKESIELPQTLRDALLDFVLAGSARVLRGHGDEPATMLIHVSHLTDDHDRVKSLVCDEFTTIQDQWRYARKSSDIRKQFNLRWENEFRRVTKQIDPSRLTEFSSIEDRIGPFMEPVNVKVINSTKDDTVDYENEPGLKAIVIGGNKLSRGLTLEGLLVSYFTRQAKTPIYDTVMQMGRWFGYRRKYEDLTRLYTTEYLARTFSHLALVEHRLREDLTIYENRKITPKQLGMRIRAHPSMLVTNRLKQIYAERCNASYSGIPFQTFGFPLNNLSDLADAADENLQTVKKFLADLGKYNEKWGEHYPLWDNVAPGKILDFLKSYNNKEHTNALSDVRQYICQRNADNELRKWTVAIRHLHSPKENLGTVDWGIGIDLNQMSRTRLLKKDNNLGVITNPGDEIIGLSKALVEKVNKLDMEKNSAAREVRSPDEGLLLLYPISKESSPTPSKQGSRGSLFDDSTDPSARNLIGVAISFPKSKAPPEEYIRGINPGEGGEQAHE